MFSDFCYYNKVSAVVFASGVSIKVTLMKFQTNLIYGWKLCSFHCPRQDLADIVLFLGPFKLLLDLFPTED